MSRLIKEFLEDWMVVNFPVEENGMWAAIRMRMNRLISKKPSSDAIEQFKARLENLLCKHNIVWLNGPSNLTTWLAAGLRDDIDKILSQP